jgi:hypothetical protein
MIIGIAVRTSKTGVRRKRRIYVSTKGKGERALESSVAKAEEKYDGQAPNFLSARSPRCKKNPIYLIAIEHMMHKQSPFKLPGAHYLCSKACRGYFEDIKQITTQSILIDRPLIWYKVRHPEI